MAFNIYCLTVWQRVTSFNKGNLKLRYHDFMLAFRRVETSRQHAVSAMGTKICSLAISCLWLAKYGNQHWLCSLLEALPGNWAHHLTPDYRKSYTSSRSVSFVRKEDTLCESIFVTRIHLQGSSEHFDTPFVCFSALRIYGTSVLIVSFHSI